MAHVQIITTINDPRLDAYQELKDKQLAARYGLFAAEGEFLVRRLLDSSLRILSLLMTPSRFNSADWDAQETPVYLVDETVISQVVGFNFHRSVLALGWRPGLLTPSQFFSKIIPKRLVILPEINDVENLGCLMRTGAALGFRHFILGPSCCDPFARRAVRTSMGAVFQLNIARSRDLLVDLQMLRNDYGFSLHATVLLTWPQIV
jgi:tRNA G18 (ribose-2'-O)-methylase SpoU